MDLSLTLHALAGLGAMGLGLGTLARAPGRSRNRNFALLCMAIALWNLGLVGQGVGSASWRPVFRALFQAGSCATAPLALQFAMGLAGVEHRTRRVWLAPAWTLAATLWGLSWTRVYEHGLGWAILAMTLIGGTLAAALAVVGSHARSLPAGPERRALVLILAGGVIGVIGGMSDFLPRGDAHSLNLGPVTVLLFLLVVCAVVVRHRFLDIDVFLARAISLIAGATAVALVFLVVVRYVDPPGRFLSLLLASAVVLSLALPLGRLVFTRTRSLLTPADPVALALQQVSRRLTVAESTADFWSILQDGHAVLPGDVTFEVFLRRDDQRRFHPVFRAGKAEQPRTEPIDPTDAVPRLLQRERLPLTRRFLASERRESPHADPLIDRALAQLDDLDHRLLVPVFRGERLAGWLGVGGGLAERHVTAEVATAFLAVGNQAIASLDRIEARETARRREAQAVVGELAAGLAHEVRNPVAAIRGAAQALGGDATDAQRDEMREVIEEETERLGRFVGEFLDYARPASPRREPVDPAAVFTRALRCQQLAGRRIEARIELVQPTAFVAADPDQLQRAFDNLLQNAWEAGGPGVRVRLGIHGLDDGRVAVRFEDNGPGIPADQVPRLFQPFYTTKEGGTGLGLALIHRIVEAHGGEIRVEGREGIGAAFTLLLRAAPEGRENGS